MELQKIFAVITVEILLVLKKELREMIKSWRENNEEKMKIADMCNSKSIHWTFSTPTASHHNGAVESMVKSVKSSLNKLVKHQVYSKEEYRTIFAEIGASINPVASFRQRYIPATYNMQRFVTTNGITPRS